MDTTDPEILQRCLKRERQSRQQAEAALEQKSLELYNLNEKLRVANQRLEGQVEEEASARRQSETRAALIIDTALDAVVVMNGEGRIIGWNTQAANLFGYSSAEVTGKRLGDLIIPLDDQAQHRAWLEQFIRGEHAISDRRVEIIAIDRHQHTFPAELSISRVESSGSVTFSAFIRDISERRQSEQRRTTLYEVSRVLTAANTVAEASSKILQTVCDGMGWEAGIAWESNATNSTMACSTAWSTSPAGAAMAEVSPSWTFSRGVGLPGRVWSTGRAAWITNISNDENFPRHKAAVQSGLKTALAFPLKIGEQVIGVMEFFAAQSRGLDAELLPLMEALGNQIGQFVQRRRAEAEADEARRQAEAASAAKSEFLAKMTHEIRTPLNGVIGMVELLSGTTLDEQQRRYLQISKSSAASLLSVINDILDFSKIEAGHMDIESIPFDPRSIVEDVIDSFTPAAMKKSLELGCVCDPATPAVAQGDSARFRQIVANLVGNALKFTHIGRVLVRMQPERGPDGRANAIRIEINDTGIGIPASKIDRLFKSFSQADASTTREYGGTGLGLAISKRLVELMGGQIGVRSRVGEGTTFWFTLGVSSTADAAPQKIDRIQPEKLRKLRILAVDDNAAAREILSAILSQWARGAATVSSGAAGLAVLRQANEIGEPYDVVLVDIRMPEMDGWAFASAVKADPALRATRLIAITGMDERLDRQALSEKGFDAFLTKPLKQSRLFDAIAASAFNGASMESADVAPRPAPAQQAPAGVRVLVAEDNEVNQFVARKLLATRGYTCDIVGNGRQAVQAVSKTKYNIVLMDCAMPEMDGFSATRAIRAAEAATPGAKRLPIIALTAEAVRGDREKCRDAGMDEYVSKPIDPADLFEKIQRLILPPETSLPAAEHAAEKGDSHLSSGPTEAAPPPLDVAALLDRSLSDVDFAKETLERFRTRVDDDLVTIRRHVADRAPAEVARLAHGLKGVAAHIGAASLREIAARIESLGQSADLEQIEATLGELQHAIEHCVKHIPAAIDELTRTQAQDAIARR